MIMKIVEIETKRAIALEMLREVCEEKNYKCIETNLEKGEVIISHEFKTVFVHTSATSENITVAIEFFCMIFSIVFSIIE
jgi:hypothetical protein